MYGPAQGVAADVEVSIVSLRGGSQLENCLSALPQACADLLWRVSLVDNSPAGLEPGRYLGGLPGATVVRSEGRRGFGANQNLVLARVVAERRARFVLVLNDDTEPASRSVTTLVHHADQHQRIGALAPRIADPNGAPEVSVIAWPTLTRYAMAWMVPSRGRAMAAPRGWLNGACILVRTDALAHVGLFDPAYFLFFEETDLCRRLIDAGWETALCPDANVVHHKSQTTIRAASGVEMEEQILRSQYLYFRKHHGTVAAHALNGFSRSALLARTAKAALGAATGRSRPSPTAGMLWSLVRSCPGRPTRFETEAQAVSFEAPAEGVPDPVEPVARR